MNPNKILPYSKRFSVFKVNKFDDWSDRFSFKYTPLIMSICGIILFVQKFLMRSLVCVKPIHAGGTNLLRYMENYCFVEGTTLYRGKYPTLATEWAQVEKYKLRYYSWLPFILGLFMITSYAPKLIWILYYKSIFGGSINNICSVASYASVIQDDRRNEKLNKLVTSTEKIIHYMNQRLENYKKCSNIRSKLSNLITFYIFIKMCSLVITIGQILFLKHIFTIDQLDSHSNLFQLFSKVFNRDNYPQLHTLFPIISYCYAKIKLLGTINFYTIQCVLPLNLFIEKVFVFTSIWFCIGALITVVSIIKWIYKIFYNRHNFIKRILKQYRYVYNQMEPLKPSYIDENDFIDNYLKVDGVFMLIMIGQGCGEILLVDLIGQLEMNWKNKHNSRKWSDDSFCKVSTSLKQAKMSNAKFDNVSKFTKVMVGYNQYSEPSAPPIREEYNKKDIE